MTFTDVRFMSAADKAKLLRAWTTFVRHGFQRKHFSARIYDHLMLHCGHIAHFNRDGFYAVWFAQGRERAEFIQRFFYRVPGDDYADIDNAMKDVLRAVRIEALEQAWKDETDELLRQRAVIDARLEVLGRD